MQLTATETSSKNAVLHAYAELLVEDPTNVTDQHFRMLLKEAEPEEIMYVTYKIMENEPAICAQLIANFRNYLES